MFLKKFDLHTNGSGVANGTLGLSGAVVLGVSVDVGTLDTPDIAITDEPDGTEILSLAATAGGVFYPSVPMSYPSDGTPVAGFTQPVVFHQLKVAVSGAGADQRGTVTVLLDYR